jgi:hypothetical protein
MLAACSLAVAACGGGTPATVVNGTVGGISLSAADAISAIGQVNSQSLGKILITSVANTCSLIAAQQRLKNGQMLDVVLGTLSATGIAAPAVGTYTVYSSVSVPPIGNVAVVVFASTDARCVATTSSEAQSGTITLSRADASGYSGRFDVTFPNGTGRLTGQFNSTTCSPLVNKVPVTCPP